MEECNVHSLICDIALLAEQSVLLVRYADVSKYDGEAGWFLPDDVLRPFEHPTRAAKRIAEDQLGLSLSIEWASLGLVESFRGNDGSWHLSFHHTAGFPSKPEIRPAAGVGEAEWFAMDGLPPRDEVAHNGWALRVLKNMLGGTR